MKKLGYYSTRGQVFWLALYAMRRHYLLEAKRLEIMMSRGETLRDSDGIDRSRYIPNMIGSCLACADSANSILKTYKKSDSKVFDAEFACRNQNILLDALTILLRTEYRTQCYSEALWQACKQIRDLTGKPLLSGVIY